jgi:hypothetical protein
LDEVLAALPGKVRHPIMVPISSVAFMEGYIENSNELTVLLGDNYFVKCTAAHSRSILQRRIDFTQNKLDALQDEYKLVTSRVGLARQWLEVDGDNEDFEAETDAPLPELGLPKPTGPKPLIEVISSSYIPDEDAGEVELAQRRLKIRELEASGVEMTDEELARVLGVPLPDYPSGPLQSLDQTGLIEIQEFEQANGAIEVRLNPLKGQSSKIASRAPVPAIKEHDSEEKVVLSPMLPPTGQEERAESPPKRVSRFKQMREQNRN